jgi:hypothetical protein
VLLLWCCAAKGIQVTLVQALELTCNVGKERMALAQNQPQQYSYWLQIAKDATAYKDCQGLCAGRLDAVELVGTAVQWIDVLSARTPC